MGTSTDGILIYGVALEGDDKPFVADNHEEFWERQEIDEGEEGALPYGYTDYYELPRCLLVREGKTTGDFHADYDAAKKYAEQVPVEVVDHCYIEAPMFMIALKGYSFLASRGSPKRIAETSLVTPSEEKITEAAEFCKEHGLMPFENPGWYLASYWG